MNRSFIASLALALLLAGCTSKTPAPAQPEGLTPYALAFWDPHKGLLTGQSGCPVQCGDYIIALTEDGGSHWKEVYRGTDRIVGTGAISLVSETEGWVGCVSEPGAGQQLKALYKTTDAGTTWQETADMGGGGYLNGFFFGAGGKGWVWRSRGGLSVTPDGGQSWHWPDTVQPETREAWDLWMVSDQTGYLLLRDNEDRQFQLVKTVDGGASVSLIKQWPIDPPR